MSASSIVRYLEDAAAKIDAIITDVDVRVELSAEGLAVRASKEQPGKQGRYLSVFIVQFREIQFANSNPLDHAIDHVVGSVRAASKQVPA